MESKKHEIIKLFKEAISEDNKPKKKEASLNISDNKNTNVNIGCVNTGNITINSKGHKSVTKMVAQAGTIGANPYLVNSIKAKCKSIIDARIKRLGKDKSQSVAATFNKNFNKHFDISERAELWNFSERRADEIIEYLDSLGSQTIQGKIKKKKTTSGEL